MELSRQKINKASYKKEQKVFDWDKAVKIIKERKPKVAHAGLAEDWVWTYETIYLNGQIIAKSPIRLISEWATPILRLDNESDIECYITKLIGLEEIIEQNRDKEKPTYEIKTIGHEDRLSPEEERQQSKLCDWDDRFSWDDEW